MRSMGAVNYHKGAIKAINVALAAGDGKVASEKLPNPNPNPNPQPQPQP